MALSNVAEFAGSKSACGSACGAAGEPEEKPSACGSACGAGGEPEKSPAHAEVPAAPEISRISA